MAAVATRGKGYISRGRSGSVDLVAIAAAKLGLRFGWAPQGSSRQKLVLSVNQCRHYARRLWGPIPGGVPAP